MLSVGPYLYQNFGVKIRAVCHHHQGQETMLFEIAQETLHVILIIGTNQGEGHGEIVERIGSQEQGAMAKGNFIDTERSGEPFQGPLAILGHVHLPDFPVEAIVEEALGQFEMEIPSQGLVKALHAHLGVEQTVKNRLANPVGILGTQLDSLNLGSEGLAAGTTGAVFSDGQLDDKDLAVSDIADRTRVYLFEPPTPATMRTGKCCRSTMTFDHANAWVDGFHACVLSGLS